MKKIIMSLAVSLMLLSAMAFAIPANAGDSADSERYIVKSSNAVIKGLVNVRHEFPDVFSADLTQGQVRALSAIGVDVEPAVLYDLVGAGVCGNNICEPAEKNTCPGDCSDIDAPEVERCVPPDQMPWSIDMVNGGSGGAGVDVAVLDTGVTLDHPDLANRVTQCVDFTKRKLTIGSCKDDVGHGTHVSGTIAADGGTDGLGIFGVAPEANILAYKVCTQIGCYNDDIAAAIDYAGDNGAEIVSMSLGGAKDSLITAAIDRNLHVLFVAAAGNSGPGYDTIEYPGAYVNAVAVGALDSSYNVADFSSRGVNDGDYIIEEREVELAAPGVNVLSTYKNGCYAYMSGTSMATPHVSGLAAKLWQGNANLTRIELRNIAVDVGEPGDDTATGFGLPIAPSI